MTTGRVLILHNGKPVPTVPFDHEHGRPEDLFLRVSEEHVVRGGDRLEWAGTMPEGKTHLWVRFDSRTWNGLPTMGNVLLKEQDHRHLE